MTCNIKDLKGFGNFHFCFSISRCIELECGNDIVGGWRACACRAGARGNERFVREESRLETVGSEARARGKKSLHYSVSTRDAGVSII